MDFKDGDYLVNVTEMKAYFFDELWREYQEGDTEDVENMLVVFASTITSVEEHGTEMGE